MRILLVSPPYMRFKGLVDRFFPIGLGYLASSLRLDGHEVSIYNAENPALDESCEFWDLAERLDAHRVLQRRMRDPEDPIWREIRGVIEDVQPDAVGISCMTVTFEIAKRVMRIARDYDPSMPLVWGGPHPTEVPEQVIVEDVVDYLVAGEGEETARELFASLERGLIDVEDIHGLWFKKGGAPVQNGARSFFKDLDELPHPDGTQMIDLHGYPRAILSEFFGDIVSSRGCPHDCSFCSVMNVWGRTVRWRSPDSVIDEIEHTKREFGTMEFDFWDDTFSLNRQRTVELLHALIDRKVDITWTCLTRADRLDAELIELMKRAGCVRVNLGLESGSDRQLAYMSKGIKTEDGRRAARLLNDASLAWCALMMCGLPEETEEEMEQTLSYIQEIRPTEVSLSVFTPFPGTVLYGRAKSLGLIDDSIDWSTVETKGPVNAFVTKMSQDEFRRIYRRMAEWVDEWNRSQSSWYGGVVRRKHFYKRHPILLAKRVYQFGYKRVWNRWIPRLQHWIRRQRHVAAPARS